MKIAVVGKSGKGNVAQALIKKGANLLDCDVRDLNNIRSAIEKVAPDVIVNPASKSSVKWCEENPEQALLTNAKGVWLLATEAEKFNIPLITMSTDHVFDGKSGPYKESYKKLNPKNRYGLTKWGAEVGAQAFPGVKIVRTSNLFWRHDPRVLWYMDEAYKKNKVKIPVFQKRSFMYIDHFADAMMYYIGNLSKMPKILHISGSETVNWYVFIKAFADAIDFGLRNKFVRKWFNSKEFVPRPNKIGLNVELSAKLGVPQYSYLDGLEVME